MTLGPSHNNICRRVGSGMGPGSGGPGRWMATRGLVALPAAGRAASPATPAQGPALHRDRGPEPPSGKYVKLSEYGTNVRNGFPSISSTRCFRVSLSFAAV